MRRSSTRVAFLVSSLLIVACADVGPEEVGSTAEALDPGCRTGPWGVYNWPPGCWHPYSDFSPFNRPIPANPRVKANSANVINRMLNINHNNDDLPVYPQPGNLIARSDHLSGWPTYYGSASDPVYTITCDEPWGTCPFVGKQVHIPNGAIPQGGCTASTGADRHLTVVDQTQNLEFDLWQTGGTHSNLTQCPLSGGGTFKTGWGAVTPFRGTGQSNLGTANAASFGNMAGRIRVEELLAGNIEHAITITVACQGKYWDDAQNQAFWHDFPATHEGLHCDDPAAGAKDPWNAPTMGQHLQLNMSVAQINALPVPDWKKTILRAMSVYGMFVNDTGTQNYFDIQLESGLEYSALGVDDPWIKFAQNNGWTNGVGTWHDYDDGLSWTTQVWRNLRVLDPCVAAGTCVTGSTSVCSPNAQVCEPCPADRSKDCVMSCVADGSGYTTWGTCTNGCTTDGTYSWCK